MPTLTWVDLLLADVAKLATVPAGSGTLMTGFLSDEIDLTQPAADYPFGGDWPSMPGYTIFPQTPRVIITDIAATSFSGGLVFTMGIGGSFNNMLATTSFPVAANLNAILAAWNGRPSVSSTGIASQNGQGAPELSATPTIRIVTIPTGTGITVLKMRLQYVGQLTKLFP